MTVTPPGSWHHSEMRLPLSSGQASIRRKVDQLALDLEAAISIAVRPFPAQQALLTTIPGVDTLTAATILGEMGTAAVSAPQAKALTCATYRRPV